MNDQIIRVVVGVVVEIAPRANSVLWEEESRSPAGHHDLLGRAERNPQRRAHPQIEHLEERIRKVAISRLIKFVVRVGIIGPAHKHVLNEVEVVRNEVRVRRLEGHKPSVFRHRRIRSASRAVIGSSPVIEPQADLLGKPGQEVMKKDIRAPVALSVINVVFFSRLECNKATIARDS